MLQRGNFINIVLIKKKSVKLISAREYYFLPWGEKIIKFIFEDNNNQT